MSKKIIQNYLNRELDDWDWVKEADTVDIIEEIRHYYKDFAPVKEPFKHQYECILLGIVNPQFNFFLDMGLGKTFIVLNLINYWQGKALVLVPNEVNVLSWQLEIAEYTNLTSVGVSGSSKKKLELLQQKGDIYICNYMGFLRLFTKKAGKKSVVDVKKVQALLDDFDVIIFDEIHKLGNHKSLIFQTCDAIPAGVRYGLTGTPFGKSPMMLWSEFKAVDDGATLSNSVRLFEETFFVKRFNFYGALEFTFKSNLKDKLHQMIKHRSISYTSKECVDLPPLTKQRIRIPLEKEGAKYYNQSYDGLVEAMKDSNLQAIDSSFVRMRAICGGYLYFKDEDGKKVKSDLTKNPKLDHLIDMLQDTEGKVIVFNYYTLTGDVIEARLKKEKIKYRRLYGATKNKAQVIRDFQDKKDIKVFLLNADSGGTGTNLQFCQYVFFYESPSSPITRKQCEKRVYRIGQTKQVFMYDLVMKNTLEENILTGLEKGKDLYDAIVKGDKNAIKKEVLAGSD